MTTEQITSSAGEPSADSTSPPTFAALPLRDETRRALDEMGFTNPTPVQLETYGPAVEGHDLIVQARTGTGKTAAFGIPIADRIVDPDKGTQVLVLAPTRELALQSARELLRIGKHRGIHTAAVYGGAPMEKQVKALREGVQIVSGTPGRVLDHIRRGTFDAASIRVLVLDEADEMLSMGFAKELNAIIEALPRKRQTLLFSATVDDAIQRVAERHMADPQFVTLSGDAVGATGIDHAVYMVSGTGRVRDLIKLLEIENPESAIVFCNTKAETEQVASELKQEGFTADWLNGDLPQSEREKVMGRTRRGELRYLVATDVAARGIDISHLTHVINYSFPDAVEQYIHRTGRTGRAGRTGTAISLIGPQDLGSLYYLRLQYKIFPVERSLPSDREKKTRMEADRVLLLDEAFRGHPSDIDRAVARRLLTHPDAERLLGGLIGTFFGSREDVDDDAAAARRARSPERVEAARGDKRASSSPPTRAQAPEVARVASRPSEPAEEDEDDERGAPRDEDMATLYLNVGRRDGMRPGEISRILREDAGLERNEIGRIRIRDKHTFVGVPPERAEAVLARLSGVSVGERELAVELAKNQR